MTLGHHECTSFFLPNRRGGARVRGSGGAQHADDATAEHDVAAAVGVEPQPGQLPVPVLRVVSQQPPCLLAGHAPGKVQVLVLELAHPSHCARPAATGDRFCVMSTPVRNAAKALKAAIDAHLVACEGKQHEEDPAIQRAYDELRDAAEAYDDALFDAFGEVTPFEFSTAPLFEPVEVAEEGVPSRVAIAQRRDFAIRSGKDLVEAGRAILREEDEDDESLKAADALALYVEAHGLEETTAAAEKIGLQPIGGTTWLLERDVDDNTLGAAPFADLDVGRLLYRFEDEPTSG